MFSVVMEDQSRRRDEMMTHLRSRGIETRPFVYPLHMLPAFRTASAGTRIPGGRTPGPAGNQSADLGGIERATVRYVCDSLLECFATGSAARREERVVDAGRNYREGDLTAIAEVGGPVRAGHLVASAEVKVQSGQRMRGAIVRPRPMSS